MSRFKFVHAADLHLDSPLRGLSVYEGAPEDELLALGRELQEKDRSQGGCVDRLRTHYRQRQNPTEADAWARVGEDRRRIVDELLGRIPGRAGPSRRAEGAGPCAERCDWENACPPFVGEVSDHCPIVGR